MTEEFEPALISVSAHGRRLASALPGRPVGGSPRQALAEAWAGSRHIVFFGAIGIAVRLAAPLLGSKSTDPAVVVVDDAARDAISLIGGHEAGANELARWVAQRLGAEPVITTATEALPDAQDLVLGIGCSRGAAAEDVQALARSILAEAGASFESVAAVATIDLKCDEPGLLSFAERWHLPVHFFSAGELASVPVPSPSDVVEAAVGTPSVAEAAALLAASARELLVAKRTSPTVTAAVARLARKGRLAVVGLGPGGREHLTHGALDRLREAEVVVGYTLYTNLVRECLPMTVCESMPLGEERERARRAIELAREGKRVALVSSGDAGIYALAGLVYEELGEDVSLTVEVIPGVTAASSAAALLGAPLMADFATISLSDLHIPTDVILRRLEAAADADLVAVLYNPASQRRRQLLAEAQRIFVAHRAADTPVGLVRNAYRRDQTIRIVTLGDLSLHDVDMLTVVVIGNSRTELIGGRMVTLRAYESSTEPSASKKARRSASRVSSVAAQ
ncbi:MAG: precorrin-3B C(17)-methyltransferase [Chloroflexi bacterium]|nr:precorrin-3B C(17)-methyltransferase [Chloroflexota bacterium]